MRQKPSSIILIGMPGSGKSTAGVILAKRMNLNFIDTDVLIQTEEKRSLQDIVDCDGYMALRKTEERVLLQHDYAHCVVATGGSAAYSESIMAHLKTFGIVVFLNVDLDTIKRRVKDFSCRGLAKRPDQTIDDLFFERFDLYRKYADLTIDGNKLTQEDMCGEIVGKLSEPLIDAD
jgi:shikimate kinase